MWAPGDIAECIDDGRWFNKVTGEDAAGPRKGHRAIVSGVNIWMGYTMLELAGWPGREFYHIAFRKIVPLSDDEVREFEAELRHDQRIGDLDKVMQPERYTISREDWLRIVRY